MKGSKKNKIITLTLILLGLFSTVAYATTEIYPNWSMTGVSQITNLGSYTGGYSYTSTNKYLNQVWVSAHYFMSGSQVDYKYDEGHTYAQGDVGFNNQEGIQTWHIEGGHYSEDGGQANYFITDVYGQS